MVSVTNELCSVLENFDYCLEERDDVELIGGNPPETSESNVLDNGRGDFYSIKFHKTRGINLNRASGRRFGKGLVEEQVYSVEIDDEYINKPLRDNVDELEKMFEDIIARMKNNRAPTDLGRIFISSSHLFVPILIGPIPLEELTWDTVWQEIDRRLNSNESLAFDEAFKVHVAVAYVPRGGTGSRPIVRLKGPGNCRLTKKSVKLIDNTDALCFARCMAVAKAKFEWKDAHEAGKDTTANLHKIYKRVADNRLHMQREKAEHIQRDLVGLPIDRSVSLREIPLFEKALGFRVIVVESMRMNKIIYRGDSSCLKTVYVLLTIPDPAEVGHGNSNGHFDLIHGMAGFLGVDQFCGRCLRSCGRKHRCEGQCGTCNGLECEPVKDEDRRCPDCKRSVLSDGCFARHKLGGENSLCNQRHQCLQCFKVRNGSIISLLIFCFIFHFLLNVTVRLLILPHFCISRSTSLRR